MTAATDVTAVPTRVPWLALVSMLLVQAFVTMAAYSMSVVAPEVAAELGIEGSTIGLYTSLVYGFGMLSAVGSPGFIRRFGAIRMCQFSLLVASAGLAVAAFGPTALIVALSALVIGSGYGVPAPSSSHVLAKRTPPRAMNLVFSARQTGVPFGGMFAGLILPPLLLVIDWRTALLVEIIPCLVLLVLLQGMRRDYDADREPERPLATRGILGPLRLVVENREIFRLSVASFTYSGAQLCFGAFMVVYLNERIGYSIVAAGWALASFQIAGVVSRLIWGWLADHYISPRVLLGILGLVMAAAAILFGQFAQDWPVASILAVAALAGATGSGFTGLAFAEYARLAGPARVAEGTGAGASIMFFGVMLMPGLFSGTIWLSSSYAVAFAGVAALAAMSGLVMLAPGSDRG